MAKEPKEKCSRCGSVIFSVAKDNSNKHYCQAKGCGHVWVPGLEGLKRTDVVIRQLKEENESLKNELDKSRKEVLALKVKYEPTSEPAEDEIFT